MGSEWPIVSFKDAPLTIIDGDRGAAYPPKSEFRSNGYCVFLNTGNVTKEGFNFSSCEFITKERDELLRKGKLQRNDSVLTTRGTLGNVGLFSENIPYEHIRINSGMVIFRPNVEFLHPSFLNLFLRSDLFAQQVSALGTGSAQPQLPIRDINRIEISLPPIQEQKRIAQILGSLDNKITLNRQLNQTLEQMAQALFKSWFVDFDPVIDNALAAGNAIPEDLHDRAERRQLQLAKADHKPLPENIRKLFPSEFELTESLGWVPKGWVPTSIASAISVNPRVNLPKGKIAKFADMKALPTTGFAITEIIEKEFSGGAKFQQNDVLLARITPCLENGKTGLVDFLSENEAGFGSTEFIVLREKSHIKYPFIACLSRDDNFRKHCVQSMVGSSGRQRVQNACFDSYFIAIPEHNEILDLFTNITLPNFVKMTACNNEIESLTKLRDTLLPKLISGELRIPEAQAQLEDALT